MEVRHPLINRIYSTVFGTQYFLRGYSKTNDWQYKYQGVS
jgi:hypothetical protein